MIKVLKYLIPLITTGIYSCSTGKDKDKIKVKWRPGINAPVPYPCRPISGAYYADKKICSIASGANQNDGWGMKGLEMSTGDFIPKKLNIKWFSYAEDKFFDGTFQLPEEKLKALFKQGYTLANGYFMEYRYLALNVYPKGGVALWLLNPGGRSVEIAHFQAKEIEYEWKSMYPSSMTATKEEYIKQVMDGIKSADYIAKNGISQEPFKTKYRQRFDYTFKIDGVTHSKTVMLLAKFYNGEMDTMLKKELEDNFFKTKAVPKYIYTKWVKNTVVYFGEIYLNEQEIFSVFQQMKEECPDVPWVLLLKPDFEASKIRVVLKSPTKEIEIKTTGRMGESLDQSY